VEIAVTHVTDQKVRDARGISLGHRIQERVGQT
jgi:hypothetical protein